jgi:hypothetical protein
MLLGFLYGSNRAWFTGLPPLGQYFEIIISRATGVGRPYWPLLFTGLPLGLLIAGFVWLLRVDLETILRVQFFAFRALWQNKFAAISIVCLPFLFFAAAFFTSDKSSYRSTLFRPKLSHPSVWVIILSALVFVTALYQGLLSDVFLPAELPLWLVVLLTLIELAFLSISAQICAGLWLDCVRTWHDLTNVMRQVFKLTNLRYSAALTAGNMFLLGVFLLPLLAVNIFVIYEAPQLEADFQRIHISNDAFVWTTKLLSFISAYYWSLGLAPAFLFSALGHAKLYTNLQDRHPAILTLK